MSCTRVLHFAIDSMLNVSIGQVCHRKINTKTHFQSIKEIKGNKLETLRCCFAVFVFESAHFPNLTLKWAHRNRKV